MSTVTSEASSVRLRLAYNALVEHMNRVTGSAKFKLIHSGKPDRCLVNDLIGYYAHAAAMGIRGCEWRNPLYTYLAYLHANEVF